MPVHESDLSYLFTHQSDSPHSYHHHQTQSTPVRAPSPEPELTWDPAIDQADRAREARADAADFAHGAAGSHSTTNLNGNARGAGVYGGYSSTAGAFQMDRRVLRDLVKEKFGVEVVRIRFLSSGTFDGVFFLIL